MEIPENKVNEDDKVEKACQYVLERVSKGESATLCWSQWPHWVASEVAKRFIAKGYHAKTIDNMRGNGPSWFWYGITIAPYHLNPTSLPKSVGTVLG